MLQGIFQPLHCCSLLRNLFQRFGRVLLQRFKQIIQQPLKALRLIAHSFQTIAHGGSFPFDALYVILLLQQKIALLEQLHAVRRVAHRVFKAIRLHVILHVVPQKLQLHVWSSFIPKSARTAHRRSH